MWKNKLFKVQLKEKHSKLDLWLNKHPASRPDRYIHLSVKPTALCQVSHYTSAGKKSIQSPEKKLE